jgi:PKD repeat protein
MYCYRRLLFVASFALCLLLPACGGGKAVGEGQTAQPAVQSSAPALPSPAELAHNSSASAISTLTGANFAADWPHQHVEMAGTSARFTPDWQNAYGTSADGIAFALYHFNLPSGSSAETLPVELEWYEAPAGGVVYLGLADYASGRWDWLPCPDGTLAVSDYERYLNEGNLIVCVLVLGRTVCELKSLSAGLDPTGNTPPVAIILVRDGSLLPKYGGFTNFDAECSYDLDGSIVEYAWDFDGDGVYDSSGSESRVNHEYRDHSGETLETCLRVTDNRGAQSKAYATIVIRGPDEVFRDLEPDDMEDPAEWAPLAKHFPAPGFFGYTGELRFFFPPEDHCDYYLLHTPAAGTLHVELDCPNCDIDLRLFRLNSDQSIAVQVASAESVANPDVLSFNCPAAGDYYLKVYWSGLGPVYETTLYTLHCSFAVAGIQLAPSLQANPSSGAWPLTVNFDASGSSGAGTEILSYDYDFDGDGVFESLDAGPVPQHIYSDHAGELHPAVRITIDFGFTAIASTTVTVLNDKPVAVSEPSLAIGERPLTVVFNAAKSRDAEGAIAKYEWDFNDDGVYDVVKAGIEPAEATAEAVYYAPGTYRSVLRVTDGTGQTASMPRVITVAGGPDDEHERDNDFLPANTEADAALAIALPAFPFADYFGRVGPVADTAIGGLPGDPDDWYKFELAGSGLVELSLDYCHAMCDIDMRLYAAGDLVHSIAKSEGITGAELLQLQLPAGVYYLRVYALGPRPVWGGYAMAGVRMW